jgi:hypothetical protein
MCIGALTIVADFMGAIGSGTGVALLDASDHPMRFHDLGTF